MSYNSILQSNNTDLQAILDTINALPEAGAGGVELPTLTNEGIAENLLSGKELIDGDGKIIIGSMPNNGIITSTMDGIETKIISIPEGYTSGGTISLDGTIDEEVREQSDLIEQIKNVANNLPEASEGDGNESTGTCSQLTLNAEEGIFLGYVIYSTNGEYNKTYDLMTMPRIVSNIDINTVVLIEVALSETGSVQITEAENVEFIYKADYLILVKCTSTEPASIYFKNEMEGG